MSPAVAHRVMDHGEQQRIHPFFGSFAKTRQDPDPSHAIPGHEFQVTELGQTPTSYAKTPSTHGVHSRQSFLRSSESQENAFEEDPNTERRKRLKISMNVTAPNVETEEKTQTSLDHTKIPSLPKAGNSESQKATSAPRKILKLNVNGKLLSSPPPQRETFVHVKASNKRKTNARKKETQGVIIKYEKNSHIGKKIDEIINGRERYNDRGDEATRHTFTKKNDIKPPKPTHPFFLVKKSVGSTPEEPKPSASNLTAQHTSTKSAVESQPSVKNSFSRSVFAKTPDIFPPIWPPKDFVHLKAESFEHRKTSASLNFAKKKNKQRAVHITETENLLACEYQRVRKEMEDLTVKLEETPLRVPTRSVASGPTLQKSMKSLLSLNVDSKSRYESGYQGEQGRAHPGIAKVYASIGTSTTSFDRGTCDSVQWAQKYGPVCAEEVLQSGPEARMLRDWLKKLMISSVETGSTPTNKDSTKGPGNRKHKRRKIPDRLDGFIVSSGDEASEMDELVDSDDDELAVGFGVAPKRTVIRVGDSVGEFRPGESGRVKNAALISGPNGCGKSASVYAVAKELDFEVFEINSGTRRSAKDILERVGDMTQNHLVQLEGKDEEVVDNNYPLGHSISDGKQNKMNMFFKPTVQIKPKDSSKRLKSNVVKGSSQESVNPSSRPYKQSLILLEEVDVLFDEDKQFWIAVLALIEQSKRPVIMTCNNEDLVPIGDISLHAIYRFHAPPSNLAVDYLLVMAANEGHMLRREAICELYSASNQDLRKSIMELDFWCQMAVGSKKSGIDWILDRWPAGSDVDCNGDMMKVISLHTYQRCMGWFNRDILLSDKSLNKETELLLECREWWGLNFDTDGGNCLPFDYPETTRTGPTQSRPGKLQKAMVLADSISAFDTFSHHWSLDPNQDDLDTTTIDLPEKEKSNYLESYPLLIADRKSEYTSIFTDIGATAHALMRHIALGVDSLQDDSLSTDRVLARESSITKTLQFSFLDYLEAFEPIMQPNYLTSQPSGRPAPSFGNGASVVAEDLAPYIRSIVGFDLRLERYRNELSGFTGQGSTKRKLRTTRASRAALEGGSKSSIRRERWFACKLNSEQILATGLRSWQDALAQEGFLTLPSAVYMPQTLNFTDSESSHGTDAEAESRHIQSE